MDKLTAMTAFVRVVEAGTFTKAADTLKLPPSSVTRMVQGLEAELKVRLLHRTTRAVTVTPEGGAYYERVAKLLAELSDIESATKLQQGNLSGKVTVEMPSVISAVVVVPALPQFYAQYPDIELEIGVTNRPSDMVAEGVDCAIRMGIIEEEYLVARRIGNFSFATCATPALIETFGRPESPGDLARMPTVGMEYGRTGKPLPYRFMDGQKLFDVPLKHQLIVNDLSSYVAAAVAGIGVIQVPLYGVTQALAAGQLQLILDDWKTEIVPVHMLYAPNRYLNASIRVFINWVAELFEQHQDLRRV
ncbi:MAG: LysR family transcriptional regulator [Burkholderiales bacterium]|nr:MAG: LysR family transcriptional regulator [Burkholderiales bacterium]